MAFSFSFSSPSSSWSLRWTLVVALLSTGTVCLASFAPTEPVFHFQVSPQYFSVNGSRHDTFITLYPATPLSTVFLLQSPRTGLHYGFNCTNPPSELATHIRTPELTLDLRRRAQFEAWRLDDGVYHICYRNATQPTSVALPQTDPHGNVSYHYTNVFRGYGLVDATVTIRHFRECAGGTFGVCKVTPLTASGSQSNTTFTLTYAAAGRRAFLMQGEVNGVTAYTCATPPPMDTGLRTPIAEVGYDSKISMQTGGLEPGTYHICFKNSSLAAYAPLDQTVVVSGSIDSGKTTLACCGGNLEVGQRTYCQITALDSNGNPAGSEEDVCRMKVCPLTDGRGNTIEWFAEPYFVSTGLFEFHFTASGSGCGASAGVAIDGRQVANNMITYFTLTPGPEHLERATSDCAFVGGNAVCNVTRRDVFGNPRETCSFNHDLNDIVCV